MKRWDPNGEPVGREVVALFQHDAQTQGAERAIRVTLGKFSEPARKVAIVCSPTVDLIDGERVAGLVKDQRLRSLGHSSRYRAGRQIRLRRHRLLLEQAASGRQVYLYEPV